MGHRSANNPRYQKHSKIGKTRKSAASAKPKRVAGEKADARTAKGKSKRVSIDPDTPEFKFWRKIWLALLAAAALFSVGMWVFQETIWGTSSLAVAYACLIAAFYIDFTKIRRMRKEWRGGKDKDSKD